VSVEARVNGVVHDAVFKRMSSGLPFVLRELSDIARRLGGSWRDAETTMRMARRFGLVEFKRAGTQWHWAGTLPAKRGASK
jgi:hypothetical protein